MWWSYSILSDCGRLTDYGVEPKINIYILMLMNWDFGRGGPNERTHVPQVERGIGDLDLRIWYECCGYVELQVYMYNDIQLHMRMLCCPVERPSML